MMNGTKFTRRKLYRITLQAVTPVAVGSGEKNLLTDSLVAVDANGLPYIPATSIAGVVRHFFDEATANEYFGVQDDDNRHGSKVIFTEAKIVKSREGRVADGLLDVEEEKDDLLSEYSVLPIRQHVRIDNRGVSADKGKFDNQVVYAGTRFCFEMECLDTDPKTEEERVKQEKFHDKLLEVIGSNMFRLGSGTRNGLGKMEIIYAKECTLDLKDSKDLELYASKSSNLDESSEWKGWKEKKLGNAKENGITYVLNLRPDDFFMFGSGFGDEDVDMNAVEESIIEWEGDNGHIESRQTLIPATSMKGAISHRTAYHFNRRNGFVAGSEEAKTGGENLAIRSLFGYENQEEKKQCRGIVLFSDVFKRPLTGKIFNHVAIDRFTGGGIEGFLFAEKPLYRGPEFEFRLEVGVTEMVNIPNVMEALEDALIDICMGMLPLGGSVNRGYGIFRSKELVKIENGKETVIWK